MDSTGAVLQTASPICPRLVSSPIRIQLVQFCKPHLLFVLGWCPHQSEFSWCSFANLISYLSSVGVLTNPISAGAVLQTASSICPRLVSSPIRFQLVRFYKPHILFVLGWCPHQSDFRTNNLN